MRRFTARFSFEIQGLPARDPQEAASLALKEVSLRLKAVKAREGVFRVFLGRHEIGRVFTERDRE